MIVEAYFTRIVSGGEKMYGFAETISGEVIYIPARCVEEFDLSEDDVGTKNKMAVIENEKDGTGYVCTTLLIEDSAMQQAYEMLKEEVSRLQAILDENGIDYE